MAIIKCKMCGGDLELIPGQSVAECEYCGSRQTVPVADNDKKMTLFARANRLRAACEFDKAAGVYESIVADFPEEAEAYWGLVLCKYGIEYVDDPATGKKIPTCHRSSFDSIMEDSDFEQSLENADVVARKQYREEAKQIEEIRKGIIAVSANEQPYDIFICYKETDENGERTLDSVLAQDIYDALTAKNYRVFFSRITLEDKLGLEYEPYIFAALNSAKIMLAVGTDYEYYNAVWVKNEWSRYLKLMAKDKDKHLIPCFKGIDAYDMPKEFARLQAQDLGKVGAMQDLLRGIEKILPKNQSVTVVQEKVVVHTENAAVEPLLKRAFLFLEDCDWKAADEYCEKVLDLDPENAQAYLGKLLVSVKRSSLNQLFQDFPKPITINTYFKKVLYYADDDLKSMLTERAESAEKIWLKRKVELAENHLSKKEWVQAKMCCDIITLFESQNNTRLYTAKAQLYKWMLSLKVSSFEGLSRLPKPLSEYDFFQNMIHCEDRELKAQLQSCVDRQQQLFKESESAAKRLQPLIASHQKKHYEQVLTVANYHSVALQSNGTVVSVGDNTSGQCDVSKWHDVIAVAAGNDNAVGLRADGTVWAVGGSGADRYDVSDWRNVIAIAAGKSHIVGLRKDGTVVATSAGGYSYYGELDVSKWYNVTAIAAGDSYTIGFRSDGTVLATGYDWKKRDISSWKDVIALATGYTHAVGLRTDGTVVAIGNNRDGQCDISEWYNVIAIAAGNSHTVGLRTDGTVIAAGSDYHGQCDVSSWNEIIDIAATEDHTVGLRSDGTVVATGKNYYGQCNVSDWKNVIAIATSDYHTIGLRSDGTVVAAGENKKGECNVSFWRDIAIPTSDSSFAQEVQRQIAERKAKQEREINLLKEEKRNLRLQLAEQTKVYSDNFKKIFGEGAKLKKAAQAEMDRLNAQIAQLEKRIAELGGEKL